MALQKQKVAFTFGGSVDEHVDSKLVDSGYIELDNVDRDKLGTLEKRKGYLNESLTSGHTFHSVVPAPGGYLALAKDEWRAVNTTANNDFSVLTAHSAKVTGWRARFLGADVEHHDIATDGTYVCLTWNEASGSTFCQVFSIADQSPVTEKITVHASGMQPKVVKLGDNFAIFYLRTTSTLAYKVLTVSTWSLGSENTVTTNTPDSGSDRCFDVGEGEDASNNSDVYVMCRRLSADGYLAFKINTSNTVTQIASGTFAVSFLDVRGYYLDSANTVIAAAVEDTGGASVSTQLISIDADASSINWGWTDASKGDTDAQQVSVSRAVNTSGTSTVAKAVVSHGAQGGDIVRFLDFTLDGTLGSANTDLTGSTGNLSAKQYFINESGSGNVYTNIGRFHGGADFQHEIFGYLTVSGGPTAGSDLNWTPTAIAAHNDSSDDPAIDGGLHGSLPSAVRVSDEKILTASLLKVAKLFDATGSSATFEYAVQFTLIDHSGPATPGVEAGGGVLVSGGICRHYSGGKAQENSPMEQPAAPSVAAGGSTGLTGDYSYRYVWTYEDSNGDLHRSVPSAAGTITASNTDIDITVSCPTVSDQASAYRAVLYRTEASGSVYYEVGSIDCDTTDSVTLTGDDTSDATLITQPLLYTEGGVFEAQSPPPLKSLVTARQRVWGINALKQNEIWPSKLAEIGIAPEWNAALRVNVPETKAVGLAAFDDKLVVFTENKIYVQLGDGPDNVGAGSWPPLQLIPSPVGCSNELSIVVSDLGAFFEAEDKIWLLDRSLNVQPIGLRVKDFSSNAAIVGGDFFPSEEEVRWGLADQTILVYNTTERAWHTHSPVVSGSDINHLVRSGGGQTIFVANDDVYRESTGFADESTTFQGITIVTPWLKLAQLQGFQRIYSATILGEFVDDHDLTVEIGYDFSDTYSETKTFNQDVGGGDTQLSPYQLRVMPAKQKCQAIRFRIKDVEPAKGASAGPKLTGLLIEYGTKRGAGFKTLASSHTT